MIQDLIHELYVETIRCVWNGRCFNCADRLETGLICRVCQLDYSPLRPLVDDYNRELIREHLLRPRLGK